MQKTLTTFLVSIIAMPVAVSAQVRIERPITLQTSIQIKTAVIARYDSLDNFLQSTAREKLATASAVLQKEVAGPTEPDVVVAHARAEVLRQFPKMTTAQQDRMVFLALTAAVQAAQDQKDSMGDLGTEVSLRMQAYQERYSRFMEMLSNMMKKQSETSASIISNLK